MLRRIAASALPLLALLGSAATTATAAPAVPPSGDRLTVTVADSGLPDADGTYELDCRPTGGTHPDAQQACERLDEVTVWGKDPFAPVAPDALCTQVYGGPQTARVTGTWAGRPVDTTYRRTNGCEMSRWDGMVPLLPAAGAGA
ncbi:SSI family serine proteinase inhibitor [Streptomyces sp. NPDC051561]|uniref:SSI family serine proteinase inhibitor n=1 Tax=Streptomyces sp. NPDC051561 TaxID=3365658 RepID=UPI00379811AD